MHRRKRGVSADHFSLEFKVFKARSSVLRILFIFAILTPFEFGSELLASSQLRVCTALGRAFPCLTVMDRSLQLRFSNVSESLAGVLFFVTGFCGFTQGLFL